MFRTLSLIVILVGTASTTLAATPDVDQILISGKLDEGETTLDAYLSTHPNDDVAYMGLGAIRLIHSVERLSRSLLQFGIKTRGVQELEALIPDVPAPTEPLTYPMFRKILQRWTADLELVDATLARVKDKNVKLTLHVAQIPLTLGPNGVGRLTLLPTLRNLRLGPPGKEADFVITFDRADVDWLRGYCHLMQAIGEIGLAYDGQGVFDVFAHRVFKHVKVPHPFLQEPNRQENRGWFDYEEIMDVIAAIHMFRLPVLEPKRMEVALSHLEQTLSLSRQMWKRVLAETDNDHEWIPSPKQTGAINIRVTDEMLQQWMVALQEMESILQGKKLLPFWRGKPTYGVNLRRVFLEPTPLDLVLWIQGTAAIPYLEEGDLTPSATWREINQAFNGQFLGFGLWFN